MRIAILGFGAEGLSLFRFLKNNPRYQDAELWILDKNRRLKTPRGAKKVLGRGYLKNLARFDLIFRSPGIPRALKELNAARKKGVGLSSATKLFFEEARKRGVKIIGVTGSKGKSTTATLLYKMLKAGGKRVFLAGNIGKPPLDILPKLRKNDLAVLELSSFQLQDLETSPQIAVLLELFPEHLDVRGGHGGHKNLKEYYSAKANIARFQKKDDALFFLRHNPATAKIARLGRGRKFPVSERGSGAPFRASDLKLRGLHMYRNALAAAAAAKWLGVPAGTIKKTAAAFPGIQHRLEFVRRVGGAEFYNDSVATNPQAAAAAIRAFSGKNIILLAGGFDKNLNYSPLAKALPGSGVRLILLYGQNKKKIQMAVRSSGVPTKLVPDLKDAVKLAYLCAKSRKPKAGNWVILLSPAAASFDRFAGYADRGRKFKEFVRELKP